MEHKLCVLVDFENIAAGSEREGMGRFDLRPVLRRMKDKGRILVSRAYGDWGRFAKYKQSLLEQGVTMMELTSYKGQEKNRADIALVVDAMEIAYTREHIDTFVVLSGDSDFTPLILRLKELNKRVIGIGTRGSSSRLLIESCDEFIFYDTLLRERPMERPIERSFDFEVDVEMPAAAPQPPAPPVALAEDPRPAAPPPPRPAPPPSLDKEVAFSLLVETLQGIQKDDPGPVLAGLVKQSMQRKEPAFDENEYGYAGFARFLEAARDKGLVNLRRSEKAGGYQVDLPTQEAPEEVPLPIVPMEIEPDLDLPALQGEAARLRERLSAAGLHPTSHMIRHTVVHELVDHVAERQARKKRNTLLYAYGDIARRCRTTDPMVPAKQVRHVLNALKYAGELTHADGRPVRSPSAQFTVKRDADELVVVLRRFYLRTLIELGETVFDALTLSRLLWDDDAHIEEAEALLQGGGAPDPLVDPLPIEAGPILPLSEAPTESPTIELPPEEAVPLGEPTVGDPAPDEPTPVEIEPA